MIGAYMKNINLLIDFPFFTIINVSKEQIILHPFDTFCFAIATQNTQDERIRGDFLILIQDKQQGEFV